MRQNSDHLENLKKQETGGSKNLMRTSVWLDNLWRTGDRLLRNAISISLSRFSHAPTLPLLEGKGTVNTGKMTLPKGERERLKQLIFENSLIIKDVTLASGWKSDHYYDMKEVTFLGEGSELIARLVFDEIRGNQGGSVGGLESGAIPIVTSLVNYAYKQGVDITGFYVRQRPKEHGLRRFIEGIARAPVIIVDDVITTGSSAMKAVQAVQDSGLKIHKVIAVVDRGEEFRSVKPKTFGDELSEMGIAFSALFEDSELYGKVAAISKISKS